MATTEKIFIAVDVETGDSVKGLEKLRADLKGVEAEIKSVERARKRGTITAKEANSQLTKLDTTLKKNRKSYRDASNAAAGFNKEGGTFAKLGKTITKSFAKVGGVLAGAFAMGAIISGIKDTIGIIKDFEQGNANLAAVLGKSATEIQALTADAKRLGSVTAFTASEVSALQTEFAKLGFSEKEILAATEATLALAAATGSELGEAAAIAGATLGGFGLAAEETQRVVDVMAKSFSTSALDMEKFKESMKSAAPAAKAVGISVEETTALLGTLANAGITGSKAGNNLKTSFINLNAAGLDLDEGLAQVANSSDKLGTATKLVGKNAAASFLVLAEGRDITDELTIGLNHAGGAADKMAKTQLNTLEGKTKLLTSAWEGFVLSLDSGEGAISGMLGSIISLATNILGAATSTGDLSDEFFALKDSTEAFDDTVVPLLDSYDKLEAKTNKSVEEQAELDALMLEIAEHVPLAVTEFDKYGKALGISTDAARAFGKEQKGLLILKNKEALEEQIEANRDLGKELDSERLTIERVNGEWVQYSTTVGGHGQRIKATKKLTQEQVVAINAEKEAIKEKIKIRNAAIAELRGEKTPAQEALEAEQASKKAMEESAEAAKKLAAAKKKASGNGEGEAREEFDDLDKVELLKAVAAEEIGVEVDKRAELKRIAEEGRAEDAIIAEELRIAKEEQDILDEEERVAKQEFLLNSAAQGLQATQDLANVFTTNKLKAIDDSYKAELDIINNNEALLLENENLTADQRQKIKDDAADDRLELEQSTNAKSLEIQKKAFKRNKALNLATAAIETALAVARANAIPPPLNIPAMVSAGALGAVQIATIAAQKFEKGGILAGPSHAQGGIGLSVGGNIVAEAEGGEPILTKGVSQNPSLLAAASRINVMGGGKPLFADGGITPNFDLPTADTNADLAAALSEIQINSQVSVTEIMEVGNNVSVTESKAQF
jgi:hypothetical protein